MSGHANRTIVLNRRQLVAGLSAGYIVAFSGCVQNPVTGRSQLILVSESQVSQLALASWDQIKQKEKISNNRSHNNRVKRIGQQMMNAAGLGGKPWEFVVFDNDQVNAFAMPGEKVGVYTGILKLMENDSQLATVLGHEVGHVAAKHGQERYSQAAATNVALQTASVALDAGDMTLGPQIAGLLGAGATFGIILPYARKHEYEADRVGLRYMNSAGYDPNQAVRFWQIMMNQNKQKPPELMSTHPSDTNRIAALQKEIEQLS